MSPAKMFLLFISAINVIILVQAAPMLSQPLIQGTAEVPSFYKLVLQWGISFCRNESGVLCRQPVPQEFTIHGFWPYNQSGHLLPPCQDGMRLFRYDVVYIQGIDENWPSHLAKVSNFKFWLQQWDKHGRCLGLKARQYFEKVIDLKRKIDFQLGGSLIQFFRDKGLPPDDRSRYDAYWFLGEIRNKIKVNTQMQCNINREGDYQLYEIKFCFTKDLQLRNCPSHNQRTRSMNKREANKYQMKRGPNSQRKSPPPPPPPPPSFHIGMCYGNGRILFPALFPAPPPSTTTSSSSITSAKWRAMASTSTTYESPITPVRIFLHSRHFLANPS